jgi:hypothetical protein
MRVRRRTEGGGGGKRFSRIPGRPSAWKNVWWLAGLLLPPGRQAGLPPLGNFPDSWQKTIGMAFRQWARSRQNIKYKNITLGRKSKV